MSEKTSYWLWYPGDFELYHALKQNFSRVERGCAWPAFWKSEGFRIGRVGHDRKFAGNYSTAMKKAGFREVQTDSKSVMGDAGRWLCVRAKK